MNALSRAEFLAVAAGALLWRRLPARGYPPAPAPSAPLPPPTPLRVPDLLDGERGDDGVARYRLDVQAGTTQFLDGPATATWGINGAYLGPTVRVKRGDVVEFAVHNGIDETTTLHWHGMILPAEMDGTPHQPIRPGETWRPSWTIDQPATTLWYHPHPHGATAKHVTRGLCGMLVVDDDASGERGLPHDYGVDDFPVIIQDRSFDADNQFVGDGKQTGDTLVVNGTCNPFLQVSRPRVRLRLLNGSGQRIYRLGLSDGRPFDLVGTDGGLLRQSVRLRELSLSTGERAEIVVTVAAGDEVTLQSFAHGGELDSFDVLQLRAAPDLASSPTVAAELAEIARLDPADAVTTRTFRLSGTQINGMSMSMDRVDLTVVAGTTEIWEVVSEAGQHNFHIHGVQFQVLDIDGEPPPPSLRGWKDTVGLADGSTVRLVVPFGPHCDAAVPYMYHCHKLRHEDLGMMGQFLVVAPGTAPISAVAAGHGH